MDSLNQVLVVTLMNLRAIPQRWGSSLVIVVGMAAVVAVLISVLSMSSGYLDEVNKTGRPDRAIVISAGSPTEAASSLSRSDVATIMDAPGIKKDSDGKPIASAVIFATLPVIGKKSDGLSVPAWVEGLGPKGFALLPQIKLTSGRMFRPGLHELIVGKGIEGQFQHFNVGDRLDLPEGDWTIVGSFTSNGDSREAELLGDNETLMSAFRRTGFNSVTVMLDSPQAYDAFKDSLTTNPSINVDVVRESDYFAQQSKPLNDFLTLVAYAVGGIMGLGAVFGALNTMYSAVSTRSKEIATLRAIGFGAAPVVASVIAEALLLTLLGAVIGAGGVYLFFNGHVVVSDWNIYAMVVSPTLLVLGVVWAAIIGLIGGLFPAIRAARLPVAEALRAS